MSVHTHDNIAADHAARHIIHEEPHVTLRDEAKTYKDRISASVMFGLIVFFGTGSGVAAILAGAAFLLVLGLARAMKGKPDA